MEIRSNLGARRGRTCGYCSLGNETGADFSEAQKTVSGALSGLTDDIIDVGQTVPGNYYLKITLDTKMTNYRGKMVPIQADLSEFGVNLSAPSVDLASVMTSFSSEVDSYARFGTSSSVYLPATNTVQSVQLMKADGNGKLCPAKWNDISWHGRIVLDGRIANDTGFENAASRISYTLPAASQRDWSFTARNVALGSVFRNLGPNDQVTSAAGIVIVTGGGSFTRYRANEVSGGTDTQEISYSGKGTLVAGTDTQGRLGLFGLSRIGQQVTITTRCGYHGDTDSLGSMGKTVTQYKVVKKNGQKIIQRTVVDADGLQTISYNTNMVAESSNVSQISFGSGDSGKNTIVSDFNWTMHGTLAGYFAVSSRAGKKTAAIKAAKTNITARQSGNAYICLALSEDGSVDAVKQVHFNKMQGNVAEDNSSDRGSVRAAKFSGRLQLAAGAATPLYFNRKALSAASIDADKTVVAVTGAIAGSNISNMVNGDSVTTAKLKAGSTVTLEGAVYTARNAGQLAFKKYGGTFNLTKGTVVLQAAEDETLGVNKVNVYNGHEFMPLIVKNGSLSVTAVTNDKGVTTCSVGGLSENVEFCMAGVTYRKDAGSSAGYAYKVAARYGLPIKIDSGWTVTGSDAAENITTAAKGNTFFRSGGGDDNINLGSAADTLVFDLSKYGHSVIHGYAPNKDKIILDSGDSFSVQLDTAGANVLINGSADSSLKLMGMGKGQAVTLNDKTFYFGNGTLRKHKTKTVAGTAFTYKEGAYYYANDSGKNVLKITKSGSNTAEGETLTIDLSAADAEGRGYYHNINEVNGKASAKGLAFTAGSAGTKFTGSIYDDTVTCGTGNDTIILGAGQGHDTVNGFDVGDVIQLNGLSKADIRALNEAEKAGTLGDILTSGYNFTGRNGGSLTVTHTSELHFKNNKIQG